MNAVDTNILFYAKDPRDPRKQQIAESTIQSLKKNSVLIWRVAVEYLAVSAKLEQFGYSREQAFKDLRLMQILWKPILPEWTILDRAEILMNKYNLSSWDALIIAACLENGVTTLYTEDIGDFFKK
ncbi:MAG TPA: PIN domain-containing protein, partial [Pyrinomonadaceae bacterium]|nr:PIN domain-containing protein [Pyrinomonadaceae bacterium]